jgi:hypothetical protein
MARPRVFVGFATILAIEVFSSLDTAIAVGMLKGSSETWGRSFEVVVSFSDLVRA